MLAGTLPPPSFTHANVDDRIPPLLLSLANPNQLNQMGVSTGWGGGARLVGIVGRRAALRLLAWSAPVTAGEGLALGLVDAMAAEEGGALAEAREFLGGVLKHDARGQLGCVCVVTIDILRCSVRACVCRVLRTRNNACTPRREFCATV